MPAQAWYTGDNARLFRMMSIFLNLAPDYVEAPMIEEIAGSNASDADVTFAFASVAAAACGLDVYSNPRDRRFFREYFLPMFSCLDPEPYRNSLYYRTVKFPEGKAGSWSFENRLCRPYEAFVYGDPSVIHGGRGEIKVIPKIGFFREAYTYPCVCEDGREWMTLLPNETNTTQPALDRSEGRVLTFGLGLGYFTLTAAAKPEVASVTVVERSRDAIGLFEKYILPQSEYKDKIRVVEADAFDFAENRMAEGGYSTVFTDLWHDPSDGVELYLRMKKYEKLLPEADFIYWIEDTLKLYL